MCELLDFWYTRRVLGLLGGSYVDPVASGWASPYLPGQMKACERHWKIAPVECVPRDILVIRTERLLNCLLGHQSKSCVALSVSIRCRIKL